MRRAGLDVLPTAARLAKDPDAGVRREAAVALRDVPAAQSLDLLVDIARGFDGQDRSYLEALGTGATGKEAALYDRLRPSAGRDPLEWPRAFAWIAWRLHVPASVADVAARANGTNLSPADRKLAVDTLAFINDPAAPKAMLTLAAPNHPMREPATWWLLNRLSNSWSDYGLRPALKAAGIYDPDAIVLRDVTVPKPTADLPQLSLEEIDRLTGNATRGKAAAVRCYMCHAIAGIGADFGPTLDGWARGKSADVIARAIVSPGAEIAQGYESTEVKTKDGLTIEGVVLKEGDPLMLRSMGGVTQLIPADRVGSRRRLPGSLMMSAAQMGLSAQDVADIVAYLRGDRKSTRLNSSHVSESRMPSSA